MGPRIVFVHNTQDGEEGDYDLVIIDGKELGSREQLTETDYLDALGIEYETREVEE